MSPAELERRGRKVEAARRRLYLAMKRCEAWAERPDWRNQGLKFAAKEAREAWVYLEAAYELGKTR